MHYKLNFYKTIKFHIRNTTKHTQFSILRRAPKTLKFFLLLPPQSEKWIDVSGDEVKRNYENCNTGYTYNLLMVELSFPSRVFEHR